MTARSIEVADAHERGLALTFTAAHRALLRRIHRAEPHGDLAHLLPQLVRLGLCGECAPHVLTSAGLDLLYPDPSAATRRLDRPVLTPKRPAGWSLHDNRWSWRSGAVLVSVAVNDAGEVSAPSVVGAGPYWMAVRDLGAAVEAMGELVGYLKDCEACGVSDAPARSA